MDQTMRRFLFVLSKTVLMLVERSSYDEKTKERLANDLSIAARDAGARW